mmetsp:Transcript_8031/g.10379  ORF Transcript_8031/g.10379 Transcript_8031/m.10379 type:complete len:84 (-) Transcript_8031:562-813(-)
MSSFRDDSSDENNEFDPNAEFDSFTQIHRSVETANHSAHIPMPDQYQRSDRPLPALSASSGQLYWIKHSYRYIIVSSWPWKWK